MNLESISETMKVRVQVPLSLMRKIEKFSKKHCNNVTHTLAIALAQSDSYQKFISEESKQSYFGNVFVTFPEE